MTIDETTRYRTVKQTREAASRAKLEERYGRVWSMKELLKEFEVTGLMAPVIMVRVIATNANGSLEFQSNPRFYFNFQED